MADFKRRKRKVGGKRLRPHNETDTKMTIARVRVPAQEALVLAAASEAAGGEAAKRDVAMRSQLGRCGHHSSGARRDALRSLAATASQWPAAARLHLAELLRAAAIAGGDEDAAVRHDGARLAAAAIGAAGPAAARPFLPLLCARAASSLAGLAPGARLDALSLPLILAAPRLGTDGEAASVLAAEEDVVNTLVGALAELVSTAPHATAASAASRLVAATWVGRLLPSCLCLGLDAATAATTAARAKKSWVVSKSRGSTMGNGRERRKRGRGPSQRPAATGGSDDDDDDDDDASDSDGGTAESASVASHATAPSAKRPRGAGAPLGLLAARGRDASSRLFTEQRTRRQPHVSFASVEARIAAAAALRGVAAACMTGGASESVAAAWASESGGVGAGAAGRTAQSDMEHEWEGGVHRILAGGWLGGAAGWRWHGGRGARPPSSSAPLSQLLAWTARRGEGARADGRAAMRTAARLGEADATGADAASVKRDAAAEAARPAPQTWAGAVRSRVGDEATAAVTLQRLAGAWEEVASSFPPSGTAAPPAASCARLRMLAQTMGLLLAAATAADLAAGPAAGGSGRDPAASTPDGPREAVVPALLRVAARLSHVRPPGPADLVAGGAPAVEAWSDVARTELAALLAASQGGCGGGTTAAARAALLDAGGRRVVAVSRWSGAGSEDEEEEDSGTDEDDGAAPGPAVSVERSAFSALSASRTYGSVDPARKSDAASLTQAELRAVMTEGSLLAQRRGLRGTERRTLMDRVREAALQAKQRGGDDEGAAWRLARREARWARRAARTALRRGAEAVAMEAHCAGGEGGDAAEAASGPVPSSARRAADAECAAVRALAMDLALAAAPLAPGPALAELVASGLHILETSDPRRPEATAARRLVMSALEQRRLGPASPWVAAAQLGAGTVERALASLPRLAYSLAVGGEGDEAAGVIAALAAQAREQGGGGGGDEDDAEEDWAPAASSSTGAAAAAAAACARLSPLVIRVSRSTDDRGARVASWGPLPALAPRAQTEALVAMAAAAGPAAGHQLATRPALLRAVAASASCPGLDTAARRAALHGAVASLAALADEASGQNRLADAAAAAAAAAALLVGAAAGRLPVVTLPRLTSATAVPAPVAVMEPELGGALAGPSWIPPGEERSAAVLACEAMQAAPNAAALVAPVAACCAAAWPDAASAGDTAARLLLAVARLPGAAACQRLADWAGRTAPAAAPRCLLARGPRDAAAGPVVAAWARDSSAAGAAVVRAMGGPRWLVALALDSAGRLAAPRGEDTAAPRDDEAAVRATALCLEEATAWRGLGLGVAETLRDGEGEALLRLAGALRGAEVAAEARRSGGEAAAAGAGVAALRRLRDACARAGCAWE